jgi:hypothetical protein
MPKNPFWILQATLKEPLSGNVRFPAVQLPIAYSFAPMPMAHSKVN